MRTAFGTSILTSPTYLDWDEINCSETFIRSLIEIITPLAEADRLSIDLAFL